MKLKSQTEHSAGGVVYRKFRIQNSEFRIKWLICKHSGYHKWVLPKGIVEQGESSEAASLREVKEETGVTAKILHKIEPEVRYAYHKNDILVNKRVEFFLMEYVEGNTNDHSWETEDVRWVAADKVLKFLAFETEQQAFRSAVNLIS